MYEQAVGKYRANVTLDNQNPCTTVKIAYRYYQNGDMASLVIAYTEKTSGSANPEFYTYNISTKTGSLAQDFDSVKSISAQASTSDEDLQTAVKNAVIEKFAKYKDNLFTINQMKSAITETPTVQANTWKEYSANLTVDAYNANMQDGTLKYYIGENNNLGFVLPKYIATTPSSTNDMFDIK